MVAVAEHERQASNAAHGEAPSCLELADILPRYSPNDARLSRLATDTRLAARLRNGPGMAPDAVVRLEAHTTLPPSAIWIGLAHRGEALWLAVDGMAEPALHSAAMSAGSKEREVPAALQRAVAGQLLAPLLRAMEALGIAGVEVLGLTTTPPDSPPGRLWQLGVPGADGVLRHAWMMAPPRAWLDSLTASISAIAVDGPADLPGIALPSHLVLGGRRVRVQVLRALRAGDVLLHAIPGEAAAAIRQDAPFTALLRWAGACIPGARSFLQAAVHIVGARLTFTEVPHMSQALNEELPDPDAPEVALALDDVELPLQIEVATTAMPIADIAALRPGQVLELPVSLHGAQVRLTVFGQLVGTGELVGVGEHLGVRIGSMVRS